MILNKTKKHWKEGYFTMLVLFFLISKFSMNMFDFSSRSDMMNQLTLGEKIRTYLKILVSDKSWNVEARTSVIFKNSSTEYIFDISQIGIMYERVGGGISRIVSKVNITLQPETTISISDIPIPYGVKPLSAYSLKDTVKIKTQMESSRRRHP